MNYGEVLHDFRTREDFTVILSEGQVEKFNQLSDDIQAGYNELARWIYLRTVLYENFDAEQRRDFESGVREKLSLIRDTEENQSVIQELSLIHHCSVTAEQAHLLAKALIK